MPTPPESIIPDVWNRGSVASANGVPGHTWHESYLSAIGITQIFSYEILSPAKASQAHVLYENN